ncbi:uncharacterized protein BDZ99DRAFT_498709 [Mytilinidion resinicola]|uniref:Dol-P-Glc:Glc(2)Man(9)GlcNAc(2)-PP-Dol alpha-1,2-glucosyltransferase n=1 Tax=Mytilinidion resinicola TaxID=574789 RepID=A0A6A6YKI9_9PEZI|nr:uncharacterized protein BDZ99DRAFT_498709 [Mytilinidion resinicola]KAF2809310.1 hypothetical protein BDZ99DRAFT_498709 [Mytilinidion resinicola]
MSFSNSDLWASRTALVCIAVVSAVWQRKLSSIVPDPYLDEVFHVRQAQVYCSGAFSQWDPKITTPPGLYLVSYLVYLVTGRCDIDILRLVNITAICGILLSSFRILRLLREARGKEANRVDFQSGRRLQGFLFDAHSALNISLFPPLFFFSALYYTDVVSTLCVLESYITLLQSRRPRASELGSTVQTILLGIVALLFRQTNIFWVAVFPAGLAVLEVLKNGRASAENNATTKQTPLEALKHSWTHSTLYDCPVNQAGVEDYFIVIVSAGLAAVGRLPSLMKVAVPYFTLLVAFGGFVAWNGGVVLGDKSNHVATLHFSQMLYIWPYIFFFSFPLTIPLFLTPLSNRLFQGKIQPFLEAHLSIPTTSKPPRIIIAIICMILATLTVHYNTIIHPFTLADNRHYVFYVFRILRHHPQLKYLAVPAYYCCGWLVMHTLGISRDSQIPNQAESSSKTSRGKELKRAAAPAGDHSCPASFVLVWLATTTLSVVTAPLVEPRYFIIPWIMWRLHVPSTAAGGGSSSTPRAEKIASKPLSGVTGKVPALWQGYDLRLCLETGWHLAVNTVTAYIFLYRGFVWPQEPGKIQRFMW